MPKFDIKQICGIEFPKSTLVCELEYKHSGICRNGNYFIVECITCQRKQTFQTLRLVDWWVCSQCGVINTIKIEGNVG